MSNQILKAVNSIKEGKLVAIPTETVYGLAAPFNQPELIKKIFELKKRPLNDPLIVHVASVEDAKKLVKTWPKICDLLAKVFWPGPLTFVLEKNNEINDLITSGLNTVGIRIPDSKVALEFIRKLGTPVVAPSANLFKKISPTRPSDVSEVFSSEDVFVLDGGDCNVGIESTIIHIKDHAIQILRPGMIDSEALLGVVEKNGYTLELPKQNQVMTPGQFEEHYRPNKPVHTIITDSMENAVLLADELGIDVPIHDWVILSENIDKVANQLYQYLRNAGNKKYDKIVVFAQKKYLHDQKWLGVLDRVKKASKSYLIK